MSRYINDVPTNLPVNQVMERINEYLHSEGFKPQSDGSWQKGMGILTGPQLVFVAPGDKFIHIEAWIKFALLPGVYIGEMGIDGAFAFIPKKALKSRVQTIESYVNQQGMPQPQ